MVLEAPSVGPADRQVPLSVAPHVHQRASYTELAVPHVVPLVVAPAPDTLISYAT